MNAIKSSLIASAIALSFGATAANAEHHTGEDHADMVKAVNDAKPARTAAQATTDAAITASVKTRLLADERTQGFDINVDTYNGVVSLTGGADSMADKIAATEVVAQVEDVVRVENKLTIAGEGTEARQDANTATASGEVREAMDEAGDSIDDAWITSKVKTQLLADEQVHGTEINVDTKGNVVTLTGTAPTLAARTKAVEIAQGTKGVRSVVATHLIVGPDAAMDEDDVADMHD
ncbi:BON domain-containing protein [Arenimonas aestuarii]